MTRHAISYFRQICAALKKGLKSNLILPKTNQTPCARLFFQNPNAKKHRHFLSLSQTRLRKKSICAQH
jgi:hypothetical protein